MPSSTPLISRRRALRQTFFFSAALALGSRARLVRADETASVDQHFLMIGDWGRSNDRTAQSAVAAGMKGYVETLGVPPVGVFFLGDNFYGNFRGGVDCPRWKNDFEEMYPASAFPGPCWAMLGNHDYDEEVGVKLPAQLAYASAHPGTRWTMPAKWYRVDWPAKDPVLTCLVLDSNWNNRVLSLAPVERARQAAWLKAELAKPRTTPWLACFGHHPLYSNGPHGDHAHLIDEWGALFQQHGVDFYFCGHDHDLQHLEFDGLRTSFVVSGGGGASLYELKQKRGPYSEAVHGFTHLQVSRERCAVRHLDPNQKLLHALSRTPAGKVEIAA